MQYIMLEGKNDTIASRLSSLKTKYDRVAQRKEVYQSKWAMKMRELDVEKREIAEFARKMYKIIAYERATSDCLRHRLEELEQQRRPLSERLFSHPLIYKKHALITALDIFQTAIIAPFIRARFRCIHGNILKTPECDIGSIKSSMQELCQHAQSGETYARRKEKARREAAARTEKVQAVSSATDEFEQEGQEAPHLFEPLKLLEASAILDSVKEEQQQEYYHCCAILPCSDSESSLSDFISD